jgi:hypothetical protein
MMLKAKEGWNLMSMIKNPFAITLLISVGLMFMVNRMPKPDKESMQQMNEQFGNVKMPSFLT